MVNNDLYGLLDVELARGLWCVDRAARIATALQGQGESASIDRALRVRKAIGAVIELPALRLSDEDFENKLNRDQEEAAFLLKSGHALTTREIASLARVDRTTVVRWALKLGGAIWTKYRRARKAGDPVRFSPSEVETILQAGGITIGDME